MEENEKKRFSLVARAKSFSHAGRGIWVFVRSTHNVWIHLVVAVCVVTVGILLHFSLYEWALVIFAIGFVIVAEAFNTAIEIDIDLTSPEYHPYARDTKDVAAGAVLMVVITAFCIGLLVLVPKIVILF